MQELEETLDLQRQPRAFDRCPREISESDLYKQRFNLFLAAALLEVGHHFLKEFRHPGFALRGRSEVDGKRPLGTQRFPFTVRRDLSPIIASTEQEKLEAEFSEPFVQLELR